MRFQKKIASGETVKIVKNMLLRNILATDIFKIPKN